MSLFDKLKGLFGIASQNGDPASEGGTPDLEMISCHDALVLVHEYLDGELDDMPEAQVKAHFDVCRQCYPHLHLETVFRDTVRRAAAGGTAPPELKSKIVDLLSESGSDG